MKVKFIGGSKEQQNFGGCTGDRSSLIFGEIYEVNCREVHNWHTRLKIDGHDGWFNDVMFEYIEEDSVPDVDTNELRKAASCVYIAVHEDVAAHISDLLISSANEIEKLREELEEYKMVAKVLDDELAYCEQFLTKLHGATDGELE